MAPHKDIRYVEKKVDESWKDQVEKDRTKVLSLTPAAAENPTVVPRTPPQPSPAFMNLLNSLAYQAMFHMGELETSETPTQQINPAAAKEVIDLLSALRDKTKGNLSSDESAFMESAIAELQSKFVQLSS